MLYRWQWTLQVPTEKLWPILADTDSFNRLIGLPAVRFQSFALAKGARREGQFRILGMAITWDEFPFEFVEGRRLSVLRRYHNGPLAEMESTVELAVEGTHQTRVTHSIRAEPRSAGGTAIARYQIGFVSRRNIDRGYRRIEQALLAGQDAYTRPATLGEGFREKLAPRLTIPNGPLLLAELLKAPGEELVRIRPFAWARKWGITRRDALRLFFQATRQGVLDAAWALICPHCRGHAGGGPNLRDVAFSAHCDSCNVHFEADFDRLTELTFRLAEGWKKIAIADYCIGGPGRMPHIAVQIRVPGNSSFEVPIALRPGAYHLSGNANVDGGAIAFDADSGGEQGAKIPVDVANPKLSAILPCHFLAEVSNPTQIARTLKIERVAWADDACPASYVATFQDFRDLFGSDVLAPGVAVKVSNVTILFTDLKGSTALYQQSGDAQAFKLVAGHFDVLTKLVAEYDGAVVKTIGDAVMAVFSDSAQAAAAAIAMHAAMQSMATPDGGFVILKVGLHAGPCFAVTLSDKLDYFGTTVNLAARIQNESHGGDIVIDADLAAEPHVAAVLEKHGGEPFNAELKGITGRRTLIRYNVRPGTLRTA